MQFIEAVGLLVCVFAVVGAYALICGLVGVLSRDEKFAVAVRVQRDSSPDDLYRRFIMAKTAVATKVGFEAIPVILLDEPISDGFLPSELYIELGDVDVYVKSPHRQEVP